MKLSIENFKAEENGSYLLEAEQLQGMINTINDQAKEKEALEMVNAKLQKKVEQLSENTVNSAPQQPVKQQLSFEFKGETYGFEIPSLYVGQELITAEMVCASKELQKKLIESKSGMISKK